MIHIPLWKTILTVAVCLLGIVFVSPNFFTREQLSHFPGWFPKSQVVLGLDLQGGAHLLLEVDFDAVAKEQMHALTDVVRSVFRKERIGYTGLAAKKGFVLFTLRNPADIEKATSLLKQADAQVELQVLSLEKGQMELKLNEAAMRERKKSALAQSIEIVRRRVDETGTAEPFIQQQGEDRILVQLPGLNDPTRIKNLLNKTAKLYFRFVDSSITAEPGQLVPGADVLASQEEHNGHPLYYAVKKQVIVSGENLVDAQPGFDQYNRPNVAFTFDALGSKKFGEATRNNVGKLFAIVLDDKVISAPRINEPIPGGKGNITGNFSVQEAQDLALLMRAGALPAPLKVIEERTVGPSLGADSIAAGEHATIIAILMVAAFMLIAYSFFGMVANIAVIVNLILLFAILSITHATLTLPGIAGIALTIGMAVDANVLINERIKEELRHGRKLLSAIDAGYNRAMTTIIDSNLTTLIGVGLLYHFGSGPTRGFAVTTSIGIVVSMFTAISLTKQIVAWWIMWKRPTHLPI
ncbi:MAG: protein translocase subunit SecD [Alphaproteobacteria bacterium]|nr:protein translocase subunit SecD [Alphaproteobacteria bacterium]